jgi:hypothetical protein
MESIMAMPWEAKTGVAGSIAVGVVARLVLEPLPLVLEMGTGSETAAILKRV